LGKRIPSGPPLSFVAGGSIYRPHGHRLQSSKQGGFTMRDAKYNGKRSYQCKYLHTIVDNQSPVT
jgi:hypothetical protein